jgi:hypothetical protein
MLENPVNNNDTSSSASYVDVSLVQIGLGPAEKVPLIKARTEAQLERAAIIGLNISTEKSELLHCIPNNSRAKTLDLDSHPPLEITIGNCSYTIKPARQIKQLGVNIDESLTLIPHSKTAASQGLEVLGKLRFLRHTKYGILAHIARYLTFTTILHRMLWASLIWWLNTPGTLGPLTVAYNSVLRWTIGLPKNTRTDKLLQCAYLFKIYNNDQGRKTECKGSIVVHSHNKFVYLRVLARNFSRVLTGVSPLGTRCCA